MGLALWLTGWMLRHQIDEKTVNANVKERFSEIESTSNKKQLTKFYLTFAEIIGESAFSDTAKELLEKAVRTSSDLATWRFYGDILKRHNKVEDVSAIFKRALIYLKEPNRVKRQVAQEWLAYLRAHQCDVLKPKTFLTQQKWF